MYLLESMSSYYGLNHVPQNTGVAEVGLQLWVHERVYSCIIYLPYYYYYFISLIMTYPLGNDGW